MTALPPFAPLPASLPATVPFVGPEVMERERGRPFAARLGANELTHGDHVAGGISDVQLPCRGVRRHHGDGRLSQ